MAGNVFCPVSACVPTDDGAVATHADLAVRLKASKSMESGFRLGASVAMPHPVDHSFVCVVQPRGSLADDPFDAQSPVLPAVLRTSTSIPSLRSRRGPGVEVRNRIPAPSLLRASGSSPPTPLSLDRASRGCTTRK